MFDTRHLSNKQKKLILGNVPFYQEECNQERKMSFTLFDRFSWPMCGKLLSSFNTIHKKITRPWALEQCSSTSTPGRAAWRHKEASPENEESKPCWHFEKEKCCFHVSAWDIWVLFLQPLHSKVLFRRLAIAISPHKLHTWSLQKHKSSLLIKSKHVKDENKVNIKCEPVWIGDFKKPLSQELSSSMRDLAISLHLAKPSVKIWRTKRYALKSAISHDVDICYGCARLSSDKERAPEASVPCSSLHGLPHENLHRPSGPVAFQVIRVLGKPEKISPWVDFVVDHVLEPLVVGGSQENLSVHLSPRVARVHHLRWS